MREKAREKICKERKFYKIEKSRNKIAKRKKKAGENLNFRLHRKNFLVLCYINSEEINSIHQGMCCREPSAIYAMFLHIIIIIIITMIIVIIIIVIIIATTTTILVIVILVW